VGALVDLLYRISAVECRQGLRVRRCACAIFWDIPGPKISALGDSLWATVRSASLALRFIESSTPAPHRARQYLDGEAGALASSLRRLLDPHPYGTLFSRGGIKNLEGIPPFAYCCAEKSLEISLSSQHTL